MTDPRSRQQDSRSGSFRASYSSPKESGGASPGKGSRTALCLWLPTFELRMELIRSPGLDSTEVALLDPDEGTRRTVWQVSEEAWEAGARPGQLVSRAVGLCPSLTLLEPDPAHYDAGMAAILEVLSDLSPVVEPAGRGRAFVGVDGLERLYGPPEKQVSRALHALFRVLPRPLVASTRAGRAPGKFAAWVAAVEARPGEPVLVAEDELEGFLASRPVSSLPVDETMVQRLERLGVSTLGELARLPAPALTGQFGQEGRDALAWATGRRIDPVRPRHRPRPIRVSLEFPSPVGRTGTLHGALDRLLERALSRPARRGRSVREARMTGFLEGGGSWTVEAVPREPTAEKERLAFVLRSRMELSPPPRAIRALRLELVRFGAPASQEELFDRKERSARDEDGTKPGERGLGEGRVPPSLEKAVKELKLRLGYSPLYRVVELDPWSRIPERRHALLSFDP